MYFSLDKHTHTHTNLVTKHTGPIADIISHDNPWRSCQSYVTTQLDLSSSFHEIWIRDAANRDNKVNITNNLFMRDDRSRLHQSTIPIPGCDRKWQRAHCCIHMYHVSSADVRTNVKPREQMTRAISHANTYYSRIREYVCRRMLHYPSAQRAIFPPRCNSPPKMPRGTRPKFPSRDSSSRLGRRCLLSARLSAHKPYGISGSREIASRWCTVTPGANIALAMYISYIHIHTYTRTRVMRTP